VRAEWSACFHRAFFVFVCSMSRSAPRTTQISFANRYDAHFAAKNILARREIVPNRFDAARAVLLIKSVL
jgi:hypothetical protein